MKKERRRVITMTDSGIVSVPGETKMSIGEIAGLFGLYYREAKRHIRAIEKQRSTERSVVKSGIAWGDDSMTVSLKAEISLRSIMGWR